MMHASEIQSELAKMARFAKAFEGAQAVVDALANLEQLERERRTALKRADDELVEATQKVAAARETARTLTTGAEAIMADAQVKAKALVDNATAHGQSILTELQSKADALSASISVLQAQKDEIQATIKKVQAERVEEEKRLALAREAVRKALEG